MATGAACAGAAWTRASAARSAGPSERRRAFSMVETAPSGGGRGVGRTLRSGTEAAVVPRTDEAETVSAVTLRGKMSGAGHPGRPREEPPRAKRSASEPEKRGKSAMYGVIETQCHACRKT